VNYRYEKEITGAPRNTEYLVNGKQFDGYDSKRNVLLDAKNYEDVFDKKKPFSVLVDKTLADARAQLAAAGGSAVEWHVSTKGGADALIAMFKAPPNGSPIKINVAWSPRITD
jgi:DNA helicase IV